MAHGRAASLLNRNLLVLDIQDRTLGFGRLAEEEWKHTGRTLPRTRKLRNTFVLTGSCAGAPLLIRARARILKSMPPRIELLLANRAYLDHATPRSGGAAPPVATGGLVTAVHSLIQPWDGERGTTWIAAGRGAHDREWTDEHGFELLETEHGLLHHRRLYFDDSAWQGHYNAVSNRFLWPLLHLVREPLPAVTGYFPAPEPPEAEAWTDYFNVNKAFVDAALEAQPTSQTCWVHDYQLGLVPRLLRDRGYPGPIGFFLHTPFPDIAVASPYLADGGRERFADFVDGILGADLAGFQTESDVRRFRAAALALGLAEEREGYLSQQGRPVRAAAYPVGIDTGELVNLASHASLPSRFAQFRDRNLPLVIGLERSDYTKGIPERLRAVTAAYRAGAHFAYIGVAAPTRAGVAAYDRLEAVIAEAAAEASDAAASIDAPFTHLHEAIAWEDVVALQREADVVFTSSLADGMNLVPLQAAMAQSLRLAAGRGVILTGRDAGAASVYAGFERDGLVSVDPLEPAAMEQALGAAIAGAPGRISDRLVEAVKRHDAHAWATQFLADLEAAC
jgi:trehalose 6-phosphate synthase